MQSLFEAVNHHNSVIRMHINALDTKLMSALIPCELSQAGPPGGELLREVDKFKYLGSTFIE